MKRGTASKEGSHPQDDLASYRGRWVARLDGRIVGQGGTPEQALQAARMARHKEIPDLLFVSMTTPLEFSTVFERVVAALPADQALYLVGGAVRDAMLSRPIHDYDFVLPSDALQVARRVANQLGAAYFPLDEERQTARLILRDDSGGRKIVDFSVLRGPDLEHDLRARDFTVNAMAVEVHAPQQLLDPLGGAADLWQKTLRACSPGTFKNDPVRIMRAIRMAASFDLRILPETRALIGEAVPSLPQVSPERVRDELFRILDGPKVHASIRALDMLGALPFILPELSDLKQTTQSPPHIKDVWQHTLDTLRDLENLLDVLGPRHDSERSSNLIPGLAVMRLGRYRQQIADHLENELVPDRSLRPLLFLAALYHDIAKPQTREVEAGGRIRFFDHENQGAGIVARRGAALHLSSAEIERLRIIVQGHMRPTHLAHEERGPSPRAIYRFFRDTQDIGVDVCLLGLADLLATYGATLPQERWARQVEVVRTLLEGWWEQPEKKVSPPGLITGHDLLAEFELAPGPLIGELLELVRESQVADGVSDREGALAVVRRYLEDR